MATKPTPPAGAEYSKQWRTSAAGDCLELVETWTVDGETELEIVHNFLEDNPPPPVEEAPAIKLPTEEAGE